MSKSADEPEGTGVSEQPESKALALIEIAEEQCMLFVDQHRTPFAFVKNPGKVLQLSQREFKNWLVKQYYDSTGNAVGSDAVNAALTVLTAEATESGRFELSTRCAMDEHKRLLVDLANEKEEAVVVEPGSWRRVTLLDPWFRRYSHMMPMEVADQSGDLRAFVRYWRLKDPADEVLVVGYIGAMFVSEIPHAIFVAVGPKGSTKTSFQRWTRQLVDPSSLTDMTIGGQSKELVQQLAHHYAPLFDNVSKLQPWQADDLCRAATGSGFQKRALYTDDDDVVFQYTRGILINGINTPSQRGDFLDRAVILELARVPKGERLEEAMVKATMTMLLPRLRRTVLDSLATALTLLDQVRAEVHDLPRMADFAIWGEAFSRAVGYAPFEFYNRYMNKVDETSAIALENDVIAELLFKLFDDPAGSQYLTAKNEFEGTASTLLNALGKLNEDLKYVTPKELPASPDSFSRRLGELAADLGETGIKVIKKKTTGGKRKLIVQRLTPSPPVEDSKLAPLVPLAPLGNHETANNETKQSGASGGSGATSLSSIGDTPPSAAERLGGEPGHMLGTAPPSKDPSLEFADHILVKNDGKQYVICGVHQDQTEGYEFPDGWRKHLAAEEHKTGQEASP